MAAYKDSLTLLVDAVTKAAQQNLTQLQGSLKKTDAAAQASTGKTSALAKGWGFLKDSGLAAGLSIAGAGKIIADSIAAFTGLAKESLNLAQTLGITTDEASRWIAVADDYQVSTDGMTKALLAVEKSAAGGGDAIRAAGGEVRRAKDGTLDLTGTMESLADGLRRIRDPGLRAAAATKLFGRNWAEIAPIMDQSGAAIDDAMRSVSDAQVITEAEAKKAEELRLAQDRLNDALHDLEITLGGVTAEMAPVIDASSKLIELWGKLYGSAAKGVSTAVGWVKSAWHDVKGDAKDAGDQHEKTARQIRGAGDAAKRAGDQAAGLADQWKELRGTLDLQAQALNLKDQFQRMRDAGAEAWTAVATKAADAGQKQRDYQQALIATKQRTLDYITALGGVPDDVTTTILAEIDQGHLRVADATLDNLTKARTVKVAPYLDLRNYTKAFPFLPGQVTAARTVAPPVPGVAGMLRAVPAAPPASIGVPVAVTVNVNAGVVGSPGAVAALVVAAQRRYTRHNGSRWAQQTPPGAVA